MLNYKLILISVLILSVFGIVTSQSQTSIVKQPDSILPKGVLTQFSMRTEFINNNTVKLGDSVYMWNVVGVGSNNYDLRGLTTFINDSKQVSNFISKNNIDIEQFYNFNPTNLKIGHNITNKNNFKLNNVVFYYVFSYQKDMEIEIDDELCINGVCSPSVKNNINTINFNHEFDFVYTDMIDAGFTLYSIQWKPNSELWVGFKLPNMAKNQKLFLDPVISTADIEGVAIAVMNTNIVAIAIMDETADDTMVGTYYTNGTAITAIVDIDTANGGVVEGRTIDIAPLNKTDYVVAYELFDGFYEYIIVQIKNLQNTARLASTSIGGGASVRPVVCGHNSTSFVVCYFEYAANTNDLICKVMNNAGTVLSTTTLDADTENDKDVALICMDNVWAVNWFRSANNQFFASYNYAGTSVVPLKNLGGSTVSGGSGLAQLNTTRLGITFDALSGLSFFSTDEKGNQTSTPTLTDGVVTESLTLTRLNDSHYVIQMMDSNEADVEAQTVQSNNTIVQAFTDIKVGTLTTLFFNDVSASYYVNNISLCDNHFASVYVISATATNWSVHNIDGTQWNGECSVPATDSCTYSGSGDWTITCSDNCFVSTSNNLGGNSIIVTGNGGNTWFNSCQSRVKDHINKQCNVLWKDC